LWHIESMTESNYGFANYLRQLVKDMKPVLMYSSLFHDKQLHW